MSSRDCTYDALIIGGGYGGCITAILLARAGKTVALIEQNDLLCRKILSTGNGRCNFTNEKMSKEYFYSESSLDSFCFNSSKSVEFLRELGVIEKNLNGYYYPITNQAKTVRDAIDYEINSLKIDVFLNTRIKKIIKDKIYIARGQDCDFKGHNLVIATGGLAAPSLGSNGDGLYFARELGISVTPTGPSLVGATSNDPSLKGLAGVRTNGLVSFDGKSCEGEIQFNKDGISGYPLMCISRFIGLKEPFDKKELSIDFVPYLNSFMLNKEITTRIQRKNTRPLYEALNGLSNEKVCDFVMASSNIKATTLCRDISEKEIALLTKFFKNSHFTINGTKGYGQAQVTAGGISLEEIDCSTMMIRKPELKGLYAIGEVCDVDGICGGYNLQWALESAMLCADSIINN